MKIKIESDVFDIVDRIKEIDDGYFIMPALMGNQIFFKFDNSKYQCHELQMPFCGANGPYRQP